MYKCLHILAENENINFFFTIYIINISTNSVNGITTFATYDIFTQSSYLSTVFMFFHISEILYVATGSAFFFDLSAILTFLQHRYTR